MVLLSWNDTFLDFSATARLTLRDIMENSQSAGHLSFILLAYTVLLTAIAFRKLITKWLESAQEARSWTVCDDFLELEGWLGDKGFFLAGEAVIRFIQGLFLCHWQHLWREKSISHLAWWNFDSHDLMVSKTDIITSEHVVQWIVETWALRCWVCFFRACTRMEIVGLLRVSVGCKRRLSCRWVVCTIATMLVNKHWFRHECFLLNRWVQKVVQITSDQAIVLLCLWFQAIRAEVIFADSLILFNRSRCVCFRKGTQLWKGLLGQLLFN